jgi:uncharacterized protein YdeI (YjbR/CyaY-like superfamily)
MELYVINRDEWRTWLEKNHSTVQGIWLAETRHARIIRIVDQAEKNLKASML